MSVTLNASDATGEFLPDGRPDPSYAEALGIRAASTGRRIAAFLIDAAIIGLAATPGVVAVLTIVAATGGVPTAAGLGSGGVLPIVVVVASVVLTNVMVLVQLILHGRKGFTFGKAITKLRSVNVARFDRPGFWRVVLRVLVLQVSYVVIPGLGAGLMFASGLWDPQRRGRSWLDAVGRVWVIDIATGLNPGDPIALRRARREVDRPGGGEQQLVPTLATTDAGAVRFEPGTRSRLSVVGSTRVPTLSAHDPVPPPPAVRPASGTVGPPPPAMPADIRHGAELTGADGARLTILGLSVLGRDPASQRADGAAALRVVDPEFSVSKTHARVGVDATGFWVEDLGSSNGTAVRDGSGTSVPVTAGARVVVPWGHHVELGDRAFLVSPLP